MRGKDVNRYVSPQPPTAGKCLEFNQLCENLLTNGDQLIQPGAQVLQIGGVDPTIFIGSFSVLVQVVAAHLEQICHAAQFFEVKMQAISVQRHLAQIGADAQNAAGFHFVPNPFQLRLADPEMELLVATVAHRASPSLSK